MGYVKLSVVMSDNDDIGVIEIERVSVLKKRANCIESAVGGRSISCGLGLGRLVVVFGTRKHSRARSFAPYS